jgi:threonine aldolase
VIAEARRYRKMVGGGMRQAGVLAAAGLLALQDGVARLAEDHRRARALAEGLARIPGLQIDLSTVQTNIVRFDVGGLGHTTPSFIEALRPRGVRVSGGAAPSGVRMVAHRHIDDEAVDEALAAITELRS